MKYYPIQEEFLKDLNNLQKVYRTLIKDELRCEVQKNFFKFQDQYFPIKIQFHINAIVKTHPIIGCFNPQNLSINLNYHYYQLLSPEQQLNLIRHELAHYIDYILRGNLGQDHDAYYHQLCLSYPWGKDVYQATLQIDIIEKISSLEKNIRRSEKLFSLARNNSSWQEAQSALLKAKEILNHHENHKTFSSEDFIALELFSGNRLTQKYQTIIHILELYDCKCIVLTTPGRYTIEVITTLKQKDSIIELFHYLNEQIDLWFKESKNYNSRLHRHSFYRGLQKGLEDKIRQQTQQLFPHQKALVATSQEKLKKAFQILYPKTSKSSQQSKNDSLSFYQGRNLAMRIEMKHKLSLKNMLLTYLK